MIYNETNITTLFSEPYITFNQTQELGFSVVNGTGQMKSGYVSAFCRVEGFDLLLQMEIVQTVLMSVMVIMMTVYVGLYLWRYLND